MIKSEIGHRFGKSIGTYSSLKVDLETSSRGMISGSAWHDFVGNSRAILGSNSGSSIRLKNQKIARTIMEYQIKNPRASLEEVEVNTLSIDDRKKNYTAISPRNTEAAMLGTLQILVDGAYGGIMNAHEHFIPIDEDCKNVQQIVNILRDEVYCSKIIERCRSQIMNAKELNVENLIRNILDRVEIHEANQRFYKKTHNDLDRLIIDYKFQIRLTQKIEKYSTLCKQMVRRLLGDYLTNWIKNKLM
jgi:hypothetical protein